MPVPLDYGQPLPLLRRRRFQRRLVFAISIPLFIAACWFGYDRFVEYRRQRQLALDHDAIKAALTGDLSRLTSLLDRGANVNATEEVGGTPLLYAVNRRNRSMVNFLLSRGADPNWPDFSGCSPLLVTIHNDDLRMAQLLVRSGATVNRATVSSPLTAMASEDTLFNWAIRLEKTRFIDWLIQEHADVNAPGKYGLRPLHVAVDCKNRPALDLLLAAGAAPDAADRNGDTPLDYACWENLADLGHALIAHGAKPTIWSAAAFGDLAVMKQMLAADPSLLRARDREGRSIAYFAALNARPNVFEFLLQQGYPVDQLEYPKLQHTLLHAAAQGGDSTIVSLLISRGLDVNAQTGTHETPLHFTTFKGRVAAAGLLLDHGALIEARADSDISPLNWAITYRQPAMADFLLRRGAKLPPGALHGAITTANLDMVRVLIDHGVDVNARDARGRTLLDLAAEAQRPEIVEYLRSHGAEPNLRKP